MGAAEPNLQPCYERLQIAVLCLNVIKRGQAPIVNQLGDRLFAQMPNYQAC